MNLQGTNQYKVKSRFKFGAMCVILLGLSAMTYGITSFTLYTFGAEQAFATELIKPKEIINPVLDLNVVTESPTATPTPKPGPTELENIVAYIAHVFEPEGKAVVVRAINCFYSESGLRSNAHGVNSDKEKSSDWGVAQLNDYWHKLTPAEKTDVKANIDRAYKIYKSNGDSFHPWYGKACN